MAHLDGLIEAFLPAIVRAGEIVAQTMARIFHLTNPAWARAIPFVVYLLVAALLLLAAAASIWAVGSLLHLALGMGHA